MRRACTLILSCSVCFLFFFLVYKWTPHQKLVFWLLFTISLVVAYKFILDKTTITWSWKVYRVLSFLGSFANLEVIEFTLQARYFCLVVFQILSIIGCILWKVLFTSIEDHTWVYGLVQERVIELCPLVLINITISLNIWGNIRDSWWLIWISHLIHLSI